MQLGTMPPVTSSFTPERARALGESHAKQMLAAQPWLATFDPPNLGVYPSPFLPANVLLPANWSWFFGNPRVASSTMAGISQNLGLETAAAYWKGANAAFLEAWHAARRP